MYNGNIAETRWRTNFDNLTRSYGYTYDALNRLTNAQYVRPSNPNNPNPADIIDTFNERLTYDKNGNIQTLVRNGGMESQTTVPVMDNLTYQYDTTIKNKLIKVTDATANTEGFKDGADTTEEYGYDPNGNMTRDDNKNIQSIVYNHLNLPTKIVFQNGGDFPSISYLYTATGKKVAKTVNIASRNTINYTVDYLDGYQYESGKLLFFPTAEGYVKYTEGVSNPFDYVYNYTDHLGNIRLSYGINPASGLLTKIEESNYYPFGLKHRSYNTEAKIIVKHEPIDGFETDSFDKYMVQKTDVLAEEMERPPNSTNSNPEFYSGYNYKYNGKELQEELGLNMYDYGARNYDPALGRWMNIDPLAEETPEWSPYAFCNNNPLFFTDPTGMSASPIYDQEGTFMGTDDQGLQGKAIVMKKEDFTQGMKHEDAMKKDLAPNGGSEYYKAISDYGDYSNFYKHYNSLPNRPDYDGVVEDWEARKWWNENSGSPLYVDVSKLNLSPLTTKSFEGSKNGRLQYNFFTSLSSDTRTSNVHGTLTMRLKSSNTGEVGIFNLTNNPRFFDTYDFNPDGRPLRDFTTWGARQVVGEGTGFGFIQYGKNPKISVKK